jgi:hypothetical protein
VVSSGVAVQELKTQLRTRDDQKYDHLSCISGTQGASRMTRSSICPHRGRPPVPVRLGERLVDEPVHRRVVVLAEVAVVPGVDQPSVELRHDRTAGVVPRRGDLGRVREQAKQAEEAYQFARQQADRAADRERAARHRHQQFEAHREANPDLVERRRELWRVQVWRKRADVRAVEVLRPEWSRELGERPASVKGGRAWDRAVEQTIEYRQRWNVEDAEHPLGREPHGADASLARRQAWRHATRVVGRLRDLAGDRDRTDRGERDDHREATGRHRDHRSDHGRPDHRDRDQERAM